MKTHPDPWQMSVAQVKRWRKPRFKAPPGKVLGFHRTSSNENLRQILQDGLLLSNARGHLYGEPDAIWAYTEEDSVRHGQMPYVVFAVPRSAVQRPNDGTLVLERDVTPNEIVYGMKAYYAVAFGLESMIHYMDDLAMFTRQRDASQYDFIKRWAVETGRA